MLRRPSRPGQAAALVKLLSLAQDHRMHREQIMDLLWPGSSMNAASNTLRQHVHGAARYSIPQRTLVSTT